MSAPLCAVLIMSLALLVSSQEDDEAFCVMLRARPKAQLPYRNAVCTMVHNEAPYLREWIEYHYKLKIDHFYIYNDRSTDDIEEVLQPYIDKGIVSLFYWHKNRTVDDELVDMEPQFTRDQRFSIADCIYNHQQETEWIGVWDVDEFLYINETYTDFQDFVDEYIGKSRDYLQIPLATFGPSHHTDKPHGLVVENYQKRNNRIMFGYDEERKRFVGKSIYRSGCGSAGVHMKSSPLPSHCNAAEDWIDLDTKPYHPIHFKHYHTKSKSEYTAKMRKWGWDVDEASFKKTSKELGEVEDAQMMEYVPYLHKALKCNL